MRIAIVHEWWAKNGGAEEVVRQISKLYPEADVWCLFVDKDAKDRKIESKEIHETWLKFIPFHENRKIAAFFSPLVYKTLSLRKYDLVIVSSHTFAHWVRFPKSRKAKYFCYAYTPSRALWLPEIDNRGASLKSNSLLKLLKWMDRLSARKVDSFAAISSEVEERIAKFWQRSSTLVYPPVNLEELYSFDLSIDKQDFFNGREYLVTAGRFVDYKQHTFAILVAKEMNLPILIMGSGPQKAEIENLAQSTLTEYRMILSPDRNTWLSGLANAKALIFPGVEDFGLTPIEAIALGTPVFALGKGGAMEYIKNSVNGQLIESNDVIKYREAILNFSASKEELRSSVIEFSILNFQKSFKRWISGTEVSHGDQNER